MTPINEAICYFSSIDLDNYNVDAIVRYLESLLPKEKEFAEKCFDAGIDFSEGVDQPNKTVFLNQLYPEK